MTTIGDASMVQSLLANTVVSDPEQKAMPLRFITATSLFDGHDVAINIIRRILQSQGAEVIHLGHNRSVQEIIQAAIQEDVDAIAVSSYQGGHMEFYKYLIDQLQSHHAESIKVFGGGGGVILADEIQQLQRYGITRIYSPEDGQRMGLQGMIADMIKLCIEGLPKKKTPGVKKVINAAWYSLAKTLSEIENGSFSTAKQHKLQKKALAVKNTTPVLGITGPGGAGKSSVMDELIQRLRLEYGENIKIGIIAIDPSRKKTQGALLGDRIRMNAINAPNIFMHSMATHEALTEIPKALPDFINAMIANGFDLIFIETPGIGQGDVGIVDLVDISVYVMTSDFGASSQLEKLSMLDYADIVAINKFDRKGSEDALHDVQKQMQRNREVFGVPPSEMPVYGTIAAHMNDPGMSVFYQQLRSLLTQKGLPLPLNELTRVLSADNDMAKPNDIIPASRYRYLSEISETVQSYRSKAESQSHFARELQQFIATRNKLIDGHQDLDKLIDQTHHKLNQKCLELLNQWPDIIAYYQAEHNDKPSLQLHYKTLSGLNIPKVVLPAYHDQGDLLKWLMLENLPGAFPYTAGVFAFKRIDEDPTRMFAGEGDPFRTNRRFKYLASHSEANRLSTAFDSVTLYGYDPDPQPDIYGKIGNAGVSVATLDDMKALYDGFDLCDSKTSVSMTINGPAPTILAMFFNTAIDQQVDRFKEKNRRLPDDDEYQNIKTQTLQTIRGTVQADILKEDQGQNTCIFSTEFSLKVMADVQEYFVQQQVRHFYSVSVSGYHIAEAGANPITQLAFTLANGFTYVEAFLARGMQIDDFAHRLSFFFSNGMDPEYTVIGRVARRIWAVAMREKYGAGEQCQKLKYHIQTSGRSLHAQAMEFNEIRTTLQALIAIYDNCNSLHTNAKDEALTTPTEETVRSALAIQMIINKEWGLAKNENPNQGAFIIEQLTDLVEQAVLMEFERLSKRGGVLGAMETGYQRSKIQQESLLYEAGKHDGSLPIVGVNLVRSMSDKKVDKPKVARSTEQEKSSQIKRLKLFKQRHHKQTQGALKKLKQAAMSQQNVFNELMDTVRVCSLGQITEALFEVGGKYRRNM
ncbi:MAG: methylmalonyl-CoA mutase family protein [Methylococcaceae bacterium]|nr:methylmalonyl-CoA mutase family protein [Methylococcaceae bacterium]